MWPLQQGGGRGRQGLGSWYGWGIGAACVTWLGDAGEATGDAMGAPRLLQGQARNTGRDCWMARRGQAHYKQRLGSRWRGPRKGDRTVNTIIMCPPPTKKSRGGNTFTNAGSTDVGKPKVILL